MCFSGFSSFYFFFFSSRRRHTRWTGDWSSDVCSSDLSNTLCLSSNSTTCCRWLNCSTSTRYSTPRPLSACASEAVRSEERRVGKECRYRWSPDHSKKKREKKRGREEQRKRREGVEGSR